LDPHKLVPFDWIERLALVWVSGDKNSSYLPIGSGFPAPGKYACVAEAVNPKTVQRQTRVTNPPHPVNFGVTGFID
jgi:hypothetical protein